MPGLYLPAEQLDKATQEPETRACVVGLHPHLPVDGVFELNVATQPVQAAAELHEVQLAGQAAQVLGVLEVTWYYVELQTHLFELAV